MAEAIGLSAYGWPEAHVASKSRQVQAKDFDRAGVAFVFSDCRMMDIFVGVSD